MVKVSWRLIMLAAVGGLLLTAGCATQEQTMLKEGYPPAYAKGFSDGCHSGKQAAGNMFEHFVKDVNRFQSDSQYAQGWHDGYQQCRSEQEALDRQTQMGIEQQRLLEEKKHHHHQDDMAAEALKGIDTRGLENLKK